MAILCSSGISSRNMQRSSLKFSLLTLHISDIFSQQVVQAPPKYSYCISCRDCAGFLVLDTLYHTVFHVLSGFWFLFCALMYLLYLALYVVLS